MIFDCDDVTKLVLEWQNSNDAVLMAQILDKTKTLIEVLVSSYDSDHREDLIQESYLKVQYASTYFDPHVSNLHNYYTTVIRNVCSTYVYKANREIPIDINELQGQDEAHSQYILDVNILQELITRNRLRFPSIPAQELDDISEVIYYQLLSENGSTRGVVAMLMSMFDIARPVATVIYHSSLVYLRNTYHTFAKVGYCESEELTLLPDLKEIIGDEAYSRVMLAFSGMYLRIS